MKAEPAGGEEKSAPKVAPATGDRASAGRAPEVWLRGPIEGIPPLLMPAAHALVQAGEDLRSAAADLTVAELWSRPGGAASIGFHLRHIAGSLERLFAYAQGGELTPAQLTAIKQEGEPGTPPAAAAQLLEGVDGAVERSLRVLGAIAEASLVDARAVGRARLPSNVLGLVFHAAEHAQRHTGQVITTARIVRGLVRQG